MVTDTPAGATPTAPAAEDTNELVTVAMGVPVEALADTPEALSSGASAVRREATALTVAGVATAAAAASADGGAYTMVMTVATWVIPPVAASPRAGAASRRERRGDREGHAPPVAVLAADVGGTAQAYTAPPAVVTVVELMATDARLTLAKHARPTRSRPPVASSVVALRTRPPSNWKASATWLGRGRGREERPVALEPSVDRRFPPEC